jgi:VWFA-related protein
MLSASLCGIVACVSVATGQPTFRSGVDLVTVDASVLGRDGKPVDSLGPDDFVIKVDGQPRRVVTAQFVSQTAPAARPQPLVSYHFTSNEGADAGRLVVVAIDEAHIRRLEGRSALRAAANFLDTLDPSDRVAITGLARLATIDFTRDRVALRQRLYALAGQADPVFLQFNIGLSEAIEIADGSRMRLADVVLRECGRSLTTYTTPARTEDDVGGGGRDACPEQVEGEARGMAQHARTQARISLSALSALVATLRPLEKPKTVVLLSEGLVADPRLVDLGELSAAAQAARVSIYVLHLEVPMFEAAQARVSPTFLKDIQVRGDGLARLAGATRGAVFRLVGSDPRPFERIALEISGHYLLAFEALASDRDGKVHRIQVSLARGGGELRARQAFKVPPMLPSARATEQRLVDVLRNTRLATELPIRVATYTYGEPASPNVRVVVSAEAEASGGPDVGVRLGFVLIDERGVIAATSAHAADAGTYAFSAVVPPGHYLLRAAAVDAFGRQGSVERTFSAQIPAKDGVRVSDLILAHVPARPDAPLQPVIDRAPAFAMMAYVELYADEGEPLRTASVRVEVAAAETSPALVTVSADLARRDARLAVARAVVPVRDLTPGRYVARAEVSVGGRPLHQTVRPFTVPEPPVGR